jgi:hypothetical protein
VSARDWKFGDGGLVRWDFNCDFNGHDIKFEPSKSENCGGICIANRACTHFTHKDGTSKQMMEAFMKGIVLATFAVSSPVVALRIYRKHCNTF